MSIKRLCNLLCCFAILLSVVGVCAQGTALALSDVDFTINTDTSVQYIQEETVNVDIEIKTQTENGYVELDLFLEYDTDALTCATILDDVDGFTTYVREEGGVSGLVIEYRDPNGARAPIDTRVLKLQFVVRTGVATNGYPLSLKVERVAGLDKDGNKEDGILTVSNARDKTLDIVDVGGGNDSSSEDGSDPNYYFSTTTAPQEVNNGGGGKKVSFGTVLLFILGAIVVFAAGVIVGFIICQRRLTYEQLGINDTSADDTFDRSSRNAPLSGKHGGFASNFNIGIGDDTNDKPRSVSRTSSIYDEEDDLRTGPGFDARTPRGFSNWKQPVEDDGVDTSYFGDAGERHLGSSSTSVSSVYDDDDDDGYLPRRGIGRSRNNDDFDGYASSLGGKKRDRGDDGYGSFGASRNRQSSSNYANNSEVDSYFGGNAGRDEYESSRRVDSYFGSSASSRSIYSNEERFVPPAQVTGFSGDDDDDDYPTESYRSNDRRRYR